MTLPEPTRWLDGEAAPLSPEERAQLTRYAQRGPDATQRERMWARLDSLPVTGQPLAASKGWRLWCGVGLGALAGVALFAALRAPHAVPVSQLPAPAHVAPAPPPALEGPVPVAMPPAPAATLPSAVDAPTARTERPALRGRARRPALAPASTSPGGNVAPDPGAELSLLRPARQLMAADPARALALTEAHRQRFPDGLFAEERTFLRIQALLRLQRRAAAEAEARSFQAQHPNSTYRERLEQLLSAPPP